MSLICCCSSSCSLIGRRSNSTALTGCGWLWTGLCSVIQPFRITGSTCQPPALRFWRNFPALSYNDNKLLTAQTWYSSHGWSSPEGSNPSALCWSWVITGSTQISPPPRNQLTSRESCYWVWHIRTAASVGGLGIYHFRLYCRQSITRTSETAVFVL